MGDEMYHVPVQLVHHRSIHVHSMVQVDGSVVVVSRSQFDDWIPSYTCHLWVQHSVWFELQGTAGSISKSASKWRRKRCNLDAGSIYEAKKQKRLAYSDNDDNASELDLSSKHISQKNVLGFGDDFVRGTSECLRRTAHIESTTLTGNVLQPLGSRLNVSSTTTVQNNFHHKLPRQSGGKIDDDINRRPGPYVFRIMGQNYHKLVSLLPLDGQRPRFAQLYIYDTENEVSNRMKPFHGCDKESAVDQDIVRALIDMFDQTNAIVKAFRMARGRFRENDFIPLRLRLIAGREDKQYSEIASSEVADLIVGDVDNLIDHRDIIADHKCNGLQRISDLHPLFMALQYPILFPYGEDGFHLELKYQCSVLDRKTKRSSMTAREYYAYVIQQRLHQGLILLKGGRLFHQYVIDAFTSIEGMRLQYIKKDKQN
ncbi:hypothetical protein PTKIN_Ptkin04bG0122800 [Pterospermum kingtungense]